VAKKLDLTKPVQTKGGKPVRIICTDSGILGYPLVGIIEYSKGVSQIESFTEVGRATRLGVLEDLENIPEKHTAWVALHRLPNGEVVPAGLYERREKAELADTKLGTSFVVAIKLEWED
jgi:hypothetical protein